jgi:hypothetical protein
MHEMSCAANPANQSLPEPASNIGPDAERLNGNLRVLVEHVYSQGFDLGYQFGKKAA